MDNLLSNGQRRSQSRRFEAKQINQSRYPMRGGSLNQEIASGFRRAGDFGTDAGIAGL